MPAALLAIAVLFSPARSRAAICTCDCNRDGTVSRDEVLLGVEIALGQVPLGDCSSLDENLDNTVTVDEVLGGVNVAFAGCSSGAPTTTATATPTPTITATPAPLPVFPADYRSTYTQVRDCRFSSEHGDVYIRVLANPIAAHSYQDNQNPLPTGSILIKEEFNRPDCSDSSLLQWRAMRKEAPGFDPDSGDWHWQWVKPDRSILFDDKSTCISCHNRPECLARDYNCTQARFQPVLQNLPAALLSITGTSASDVYAVGADPKDGLGPFVLHYDGQQWRRFFTRASGNLWWISTTPIDAAFYMSGENGLILRYDPATGSFLQYTTPGTAILYGIWGDATNNIVAVGGDPNNETQGGVIWHFDGATWTAEDVSNILPGGLPTLFKVWGRTASDIYAVGRDGVILHFNGATWTSLTSNTASPLFTVSGNDSVTAAVGGDFQGEIRELTATGFQDLAPTGTAQVNGVFVTPSGNGSAVGVGGALTIRATNAWWSQIGLENTARDFHATWIDPEAGIWAVGGDLSTALSQGLVGYAGIRSISSTLNAQQALCPAPGAHAGPTTVSYFNDIVPLFNSAGCTSFSCHGSAFLASSGYDLTSYETTFGPGIEAKSLKVCEVIPGDPDGSFLVEKLNPNPRLGVQMPNNVPPRQLTAEQINLVRTWIMEGAQNDSPATPTATVSRTPTATATPKPLTSTSPTPTATPSPSPVPGLTPAAVCNQPGMICTMAGTGLSQFDGDGKAALDTSLYYPLGIAFDQSDRPLLLDWNNLRIRRINADGKVQTIMGQDFEAPPVNGALAVDTPLHHASDIKFGSDGNLYIAGDHVPLVFRVGTDNRVLILAGSGDSGYDGDDGPALEAKLTSPYGVLPTTNGAFYFTDIDAQVVRYVDPQGLIHTVAGTGAPGYSGDGGPGTAAQIAGPARIQADSDGNLYFCETRNHVIRRLDRNGTISTFAGTGQKGYGGDNGPATAAQFNSPYDLRFAPNGDLYVVDSGNSVIRRIDGAGVVTTVAGSSTAGFAGDGGGALGCRMNRPSGIAFDTDGSMWIADTFNQRVRRIAAFLSLVN